MEVSSSVSNGSYVETAGGAKDHTYRRLGHAEKKEGNVSVPVDTFVKSEHMERVEALKGILGSKVSDIPSFVSMANVLRNENVLSNQDMVAVDFIAKYGPRSNLTDFDKILRNDSLSSEMKSLISQLLNKLRTIDYIHAGLMSGA